MRMAYHNAAYFSHLAFRQQGIAPPSLTCDIYPCVNQHALLALTQHDAAPPYLAA
jgi:hypothetical protein